MDQLLLGIDIGTTGTKSALFTENGSLLAIGQEEYGISIPRNNQAEQDPEDWWRAVCGTIRKVLKEVPDGAGRIAGVAVSSQAPILLPLNSKGEPLRPAMIWMDRRAVIEAAELGRKMGSLRRCSACRAGGSRGNYFRKMNCSASSRE